MSVNAECHSCCVRNNPSMPSVIKLSVVMLIVVAPSEYTRNAITKSALLH